MNPTVAAYLEPGTRRQVADPPRTDGAVATDPAVDFDPVALVQRAVKRPPAHLDGHGRKHATLVVVALDAEGPDMVRRRSRTFASLAHCTSDTGDGAAASGREGGR